MIGYVSQTKDWLCFCQMIKSLMARLKVKLSHVLPKSYDLFVSDQNFSLLRFCRCFSHFRLGCIKRDQEKCVRENRNICMQLCETERCLRDTMGELEDAKQEIGTLRCQLEKLKEREACLKSS